MYIYIESSQPCQSSVALLVQLPLEILLKMLKGATYRAVQN